MDWKLDTDETLQKSYWENCENTKTNIFPVTYIILKRHLTFYLIIFIDTRRDKFPKKM